MDARTRRRGQFCPGPDPAPGQWRNYPLICLAFDHPTWALGFADEVWWSRFAQPNQHRWVADEAVPRLQALERPKDDRAPKALACYGLLVRQRPQQADQMLLR